MGKNQSASGLTNIIQYDDNGNISFVSGSTTLMSVSSSGAITTTGVISGSSVQSASLALDSNLLQGTGSVGFTTTASFTTLSSSFQQVSASYISLSASYNTFSGSASTRISNNESTGSVLTAASSSLSTRTTQIEQVYATTGSNSFRATQSITGSLTVTGQIVAQTINVQQVTSSIIYSSGSNVFGNAIANTQTFTGSVLITGSLNTVGNACMTSVCSPTFIGGTVSGTTIYGSTAICSAVGKFTSCIDAGSGTFGSSVRSNSHFIVSDGSAANVVLQGYINNALRIAESGSASSGGARGNLYVGVLDVGGASVFSGDLCVSTAGSTGILFDGTNPTLTLRRNNNGNASAAINFKGSSAVKWQIGTNQATGLGFEINEGDATANKFYIAPGGATSFACQVCAASFNSTSTSYLNGLVVSCNINSNCFTGIIVNNGAGSGAEASRAGIAFQAYDWVQSAIWHGRQTSAVFEGALLFGTNPNTANLGVGGVCTRLKIDNSGVATFSCAVCAPTLKATGTVIGANFITDSGTASIPYASYATFYTVQNYQNAIYLVTLQLNGYSNYTAFATIIQNDSNLQIANSLSNVATIQVSGLNIQGTNGSGITQSMPYKIIKIG